MGNCIDPSKKKITDIRPVYQFNKDKPTQRDSKISQSIVPTYPSIEDVLREQKVRKYNSHIYKRL